MTQFAKTLTPLWGATSENFINRHAFSTLQYTFAPILRFQVEFGDDLLIGLAANYSTVLVPKIAKKNSKISGGGTILDRPLKLGEYIETPK